MTMRSERGEKKEKKEKIRGEKRPLDKLDFFIRAVLDYISLRAPSKILDRLRRRRRKKH